MGTSISYQRGGEGQTGSFDDYQDDHVPRSPEQRRLRHRIIAIKRRIQVVLEFLREADDDDEYVPEAMDQLEEDVLELEGLGVPMETLDVEGEWYDEAKEYLPSKGKRVAFGKPSIAFYEPEKLGWETQLPRHESLEELSRHAQEIDQAYKDVEGQERWLRGGHRRRKRSYH